MESCSSLKMGKQKAQKKITLAVFLNGPSPAEKKKSWADNDGSLDDREFP